MANPRLQREVSIPPEFAKLMGMLGIDLPGNIKEISTPTEYSDEAQKIILPKGMDKRVAAKELEAQWKNEESVNSFSAAFEGWNWQDVLIALRRVTEREFGWMNGQADFWTGNPTEIDVVVDVKNGKKVNERAFYGKFQITAWDAANASIGVQRGVAYINIDAKRKFSDVITNYFNLIREQLETASIYRGKSIVVSQKGDSLDFEIIENKGSEKIVLNRPEQMVIDTFVIDSLGEPGKRCYLFTGGYGTGKTETAMQVGRVAVERHGMSFFYLKDATLFDNLLNQCKKYQPCIVFLEDVDEIASGEQRDSSMNKILNTLDGVQTKGNDLTVIFTTNHPEKINSALRRPGRIDVMIKFENPDNDTKIKIYRMYFENLPGGDSLDYAALANLTPSIQGAVVAEIAKRSVKLASKQGAITHEIVESCIHSMRYQIELMTEHTKETNKSEQFVKLLGDFIAPRVWEAKNGKEVHNAVVN